MNILLVDDEVIVVTLLKKHIDWKGLGIDEVFTAYTAMDARAICSGNKIDIIVCDIEMPQENGLYFLAWVREKFPVIVKIILTGYPDFKYAQDAINIGVIKYLLKPVSFEELSETVRLAADEITKREKEKLQVSAVQHRPDPKREEKIFYTNLLTGDILPFTEFIDKALKTGCLTRDAMEPKGLVYIRLAGARVQMKNNSILLFALGNIAEELFPDITEVHLWDNIFWIVKAGHDKDQLYKMCELFISKLKGRFPGEIFAYYISAGHSVYPVSLETLAERSGDLRHAAMHYRNVGQFIYDADELMEKAMDTENGEPHPSAWAVVEAVKEYVHAHYMEDISRQDMEACVHLNGDYLNRIFKKATGYSLVQYIQYYRILVSRRLLAERKCTITEVGTKVGFDTPSYFAKVFRKWTNMTPNEYYNSCDSKSGTPPESDNPQA